MKKILAELEKISKSIEAISDNKKLVNKLYRGSKLPKKRLGWRDDWEFILILDENERREEFKKEFDKFKKELGKHFKWKSTRTGIKTIIFDLGDELK